MFALFYLANRCARLPFPASRRRSLSIAQAAEAILEREAALRLFVGDRLAEGWTPEQISGWLKWEIQEIVLTTNLTRRKCLGFKTPLQALLAELGKDVQIRFS